MSPPKISVLMPVYNGREYLRPAVESILGQSFEDFELVIVDDGSDDDSREIVASYDDPRIRLIAGQHAGLTASLNHGGDACRGEYIARMDADDVAYPNRLQAQFDILSKDSDLGLVCTDATIINAEGRVIGAHRMGAWNDNALRDTLLFRARTAPIIHPSVIMRREVFHKLGGYRDFACAEDRDFWLRALDHFRFGHIAIPLLYYRAHSKGISRSRRLTQATSGLMCTVAHLVKCRARVDIFAERRALFDRYLLEAQGAVGRDYLPVEYAFNAVRDQIKARRYVSGFGAAIVAVAKHGVSPMPRSRVAWLHRVADRLTSRIVAELRTVSAAAPGSSANSSQGTA